MQLGMHSFVHQQSFLHTGQHTIDAVCQLFDNLIICWISIFVFLVYFSCCVFAWMFFSVSTWTVSKDVYNKRTLLLREESCSLQHAKAATPDSLAVPLLHRHPMHIIIIIIIIIKRRLISRRNMPWTLGRVTQINTRKRYNMLQVRMKGQGMRLNIRRI